VLTMLPLVIQTLGGGLDVEERLAQTLAAHPEIQEKAENVESESEFFALLPGGRLEGAHLSHFSRAHWIYALIAAAAFFFVVKLLFEPGKSTVVQILTIAGVTSTVGTISLIIFQFIAEWTQGYWVTGRSIVVLLFYIVKFIGFSYYAADDPNNGFLLSFLGYTCGVGLCEELTKIAPVLFVLGEQKKADWRAACVLGLASGVGFGVAEGILYSGQYYNGVMSLDIYLVRFISCVALHATWTAAIAVMASQNMSGFDTNEGTDYFVHLLFILSVPMILHGLYDTLLKRDMGGLALVVAVGSFAWLVFCIERARSNDPQPARARLASAAA
jgi:protease PrsW